MNEAQNAMFEVFFERYVHIFPGTLTDVIGMHKEEIRVAFESDLNSVYGVVSKFDPNIDRLVVG